MATGESYSSAAGKRRQLGSKTADTPDRKLGDDLLEEILIRLPNPRSASRCKRVCKRWNSMLSSRCFNRRFVSHHQRRSEALGEPPLLLPSDDPLASILSFLPVPDEIRSQFVIWDCFKDLILCGFHERGRGELGRLFIICNPFTKQWVTLPVAPERSDRYQARTVVKVVCKEARNNPNSLDLGDGQVFLYSDYQFRVLIEHQGVSMWGGHSELQVFCSKSRKWSTRKEGLGLEPDAVSLNGKLYWKEADYFCEKVYRIDPFRLNIRPTTIHSDEELVWGYHVSHLSASHGALYITMVDGQGVLKVWRWEEGSMTWMLYRETLLSKMLKCDSDVKVEDLKFGSILAQHPEKSEVFFLKYFRNRNRNEEEAAVYSYDFSTGNSEFVADKVRYDVLDHWMVFQPRTTYFSMPIPSYEKLLGMYSGIYSDLVQTRKST